MSVLSRRARTEEIRRTNEDALLRSTIELLEEGSSFADLGIEQIVKHAGLSRPTFYTYFRDKRDLIMKLALSLEADLLGVAEPWFQSTDSSARATITAVVEIFRMHAAVARAVSEAATYDDDVAEFWQGFHDHFMLGSQLRIAAGYPDLPHAEVVTRAHALVYMTERTAIAHFIHPLGPDEALIEQLSWFWEIAIAPAAPSAA